MRRVDRYVPLALMVGSVLVATAFPSILLHDAFNSQQAYAYTAEIAGFGERWPGSPGHQKTEDLIHHVLQKDHAQVEADDFFASTPRGPVPVHNIIGKFNVTDAYYGARRSRVRSHPGQQSEMIPVTISG